MKKAACALVLAILAMLGSCGGVERVEFPVTVLAEVPATVEVPMTIEVPATVEVPVTVLVVPTSRPTPRPTATPEVRVGNLDSPVPFAEPFGLVMDGNKEFTMAVVDALRGDEAWQRIYDANMFNDRPPEGMEYLLLYIQIEYSSGPSAETLELDEYDLEVVSNGQVLETPFGIVDPDPQFDLAILPGGSGAGWAAFQVFADDPDPLLVIGRDRGRTGFFFATHP